MEAQQKEAQLRLKEDYKWDTLKYQSISPESSEREENQRLEWAWGQNRECLDSPLQQLPIQKAASC